MIYIMTMAFAPPRMLKASIEKIDETVGIPRDQYTRVLIDNHWPRQRAEMEELFSYELERGNTIVLRPEKNLGLAKGFNFGFKHLQSIGLKTEDVMLICDPDVFPITPGWGLAFAEVMKDPTIGWVSAWHSSMWKEVEQNGKTFDEDVINGYRVKIFHSAVMNSVSAFSVDFITKTEGIHENNPFYGSLEARMWPQLKELGFKWVFLTDYLEGELDIRLLDPDYYNYKLRTAHGGEEQIEFSEWVRIGKCIPGEDYWNDLAAGMKPKIKLHIGCGEFTLPGWVNVDCIDIKKPKDYYVKFDMRNGLPSGISDSTVSYIHHEHFLEHLTREDGLRLMRTCYEKLLPGGVMRVAVPCLDHLVKKYQANDLDWGDGWKPANRCQMINEGFRLWGHQFMYNIDDLKELLLSCGFKDIKIVQFKQSDHEDFKNIDIRTSEFDLRVEATK